MNLLNRLAVTLLAVLAVGASSPTYAAQCQPDKVCVERYLLDDQVDEGTVNAAIRSLHAAEEHNAGTPSTARAVWVLELNTPGGSVPDGMRLIKAIETAKVPVVCVVDGMAASMGASILQSCDLRVMTRRSVIMFHEVSFAGLMRGNPNDWQAIANELRAINSALAWYNVHRMTVSYAQYRAKTDGGQQWWLDWTEAGKVKAIDAAVETVGELVEVLSAPLPN